jgi:hypothetical protein
MNAYGTVGFQSCGPETERATVVKPARFAARS